MKNKENKVLLLVCFPGYMYCLLHSIHLESPLGCSVSLSERWKTTTIIHI